MTTRRGMVLGTVGLAMSGALPLSQAAEPVRLEEAYARFLGWLQAATPDNGRGLSYYMSPIQTGTRTLSTVASGKLALLHLQRGNLPGAVAVGQGLVHWQRESLRSTSTSTRGGLPSEMKAQGADWKLGDYYYAGDNLLAIAALVRLYRATRLDRFAASAVSIGRWLERTLFDGRALGLWTRNYGPPMQFIRSDGAANNAIHAGVDFLWLRALEGLDELDRQAGWKQRMAEAVAFYRGGMAAEGGWYDHFKPNRPDSIAGQWLWYRGGYVAIGDNALRTALAAHHFGLTEHTERFRRWLKPQEGIWLCGYLDPATCQPLFLARDTPYFDVVCTGLLRSWYQRLGQSDLARRCEAAVLGLQAPSGGWHWGIETASRRPLNREQATVVGCWALADLDA